MTLLSMRQYAKHRGVSPEAVSKAVKTGRITCERDPSGKALINPELADKQWDQNSDPMKFRGQGPSSKNDAPVWATEASTSRDSSGTRNPTTRDATAILKAYQAKLAKLDYEERMKKLVDADEVKQRWLAVASIVRTKVLGIPAKAKQRDPTLTTEQYAMLEMIVREALEELSDE